MPFNFEFPRRIRAGFIGCGRHAYQSIYPCFQYAPVELIAVADLQEERARTYARQFGAERWYTDHRRMLAEETLDAVFVVVNHDHQRRPQYVPLAVDIMESGCHAWIEKPPASTIEEIDAMITTSQRTGSFVQVGFKKVFYPAIERAKQIMELPEFGRPTSIYAHYGVAIPPEHERHNGPPMMPFLQIGCHPLSIIQYLMGPAESLYFEDERVAGSSMAVFKFRSGAIGVMHHAAGKAHNAPWDRVEVVGEGATLVVENGVQLNYYKPSGPRADDTFVGDDANGPIKWAPDFSHGRLANKGLFLLGYAPEVISFAECVLENKPPERCRLEDAREVLQMYLAYNSPAGRRISVG